MNDQFLEMETRFLILRYGRQRVLHTLARLGEQTPEDLEKLLQSRGEKRKTSRIKPAIMDLVALECHDHPDLAEPLRAIAVRFQNRAFLPHLRDVQRFLDRAGSEPGKMRSREAAAPALIRALGKLPREDLLRLASEDRSSGDSDYSLLARAIMGTPTAKPHDAGGGENKPIKI